MAIVAIVRLLFAFALATTGLSFDTATPAASSPAVAGCTAWRTGPVSSDYFPECTLSDPWWTSWSSCDASPVHSEPWKPDDGASQGLTGIPWMQPDATGARVVAHLYYGNRPLHTNGAFPNGDAAKILWTFDRPVTGLTLIATKLGDGSQPVVSIDTGVASSSTDFGTD